MLKVMASCVPTAVIAPMMTIEMSAVVSPYSMALKPRGVVSPKPIHPPLVNYPTLRNVRLCYRSPSPLPTETVAALRRSRVRSRPMKAAEVC
jgi:hypothetical protein